MIFDNKKIKHTTGFQNLYMNYFQKNTSKNGLSVQVKVFQLLRLIMYRFSMNKRYTSHTVIDCASCSEEVVDLGNKKNIKFRDKIPADQAQMWHFPDFQLLHILELYLAFRS